jgi:soluble lytic murein transglycosylase-like protein
MARIPVIQERQQVGRLMAVPQLSAPDSGAGAIGRSMQQVGQALGQASDAVIQVESRQAQSWATETASQELLHWSQRSEELKTEIGVGGAGYTTALNAEFDKRANEILAQAPNGVSQRFLSQNFLNIRQSLLKSALQYEVVEGRANQLETFNKSTNTEAFAVAKIGDPELAMKSVGQLEARVDASNLLPRQKEEQKKIIRETISLAFANSVVQNNPDTAVAILSKAAPVIKTEKQRQSLYDALKFVESTNNPKAVGPQTRYGRAIGLAQVLATTAMDPGVRLADGSVMPNVFQVAISKGVKVGERNKETAVALLKDEVVGEAFGRMYLDAMLARYDNDAVKALAGYNWGIGNTDNWDGDISKLPAETQKYIPNVLNRSGITAGQVGAGEDSIFSMLPLGEQLKMLNKARENSSARQVEGMASSVFTTFGPKSDTDAIELDVMNDHIDVLMANNTVQERKDAKSLIKQYASDFQASSNQRQAERVSGIWTNVMNGAPMTEIQGSPEWKSLDGTEQKKLITEINTFRTQPTQPAQWAMYSEISGNKQELSKMTTEQILAMAPALGNELTTKLIQDRAKLRSPEDVGKAEYDEDSFKIFASKAGLKVFETKAAPVEKEKIGKFRFAVENAMVIRQNELKRPLSRAEQDDVMTEVLSNKVYIDEFGRDPEVMVSLVDKDDMGDTYVIVGSKQVYLKEIPASSRGMIIRQLRSAGMPVTEAAIAEVYLAAQQQRDPQFEQIPQ